VVNLEAHARAVIVGAGAIGCAIAWQLALRGIRDIVVLDKGGITHGSTWHAAGLIGQYRSRADLTRLMRSSAAIYDKIQAETPVDWHPVGSLRIASSSARWRELREAQLAARNCGLSFELIDATEAKRRFPYLDTTGVEGAAFISGDGYIDPAGLTMAYAARARALGVKIVTNMTTLGFKRANERVAAVTTPAGALACDTLVLAPGVWARPIGRMLGLNLAVAALEHQYAVTGVYSNMPRDLPALRDPDLNFYLKPETGAFVIGGWESDTVAVHDSAMPFAFGRELLPDNFDRLQPILEAAVRRIPLVAELGLKRIVNGPIPVTPDGEPILGPATGFANVFLAIGFTSGIAASGGAGRALAEWIVDGVPEFPLPSLDPRRFEPASPDDTHLIQCAVTAYGRYYALATDYCTADR
jgi:4-methylaminobutanoate oxidase (formaldehyde-forming)